MLAVAINYQGAVEEKNLGSTLMKIFDGFKLIKLYPSDDLAPDRLQLCRSEGYAELIKDIQEYRHPVESLLELRGPRIKLLRAVRHMFFFEEEKKYDQVFLEGGNGIIDFPWAFQLVLVEPPVSEWEQKPRWIKEADMMVIGGDKSEKNKNFIARIKKIRPDVPIYTEKIQNDLSPELKENLELLFAAYVEKRKKTKDALQLQYPKPQITCEQAQEMAGKLGVSLFLLGSVCDELGYSVIRCRLGCF
ncbi:MAG: hypothetical protein HQP61_07525 [Peptococcaceae bacterium]|nr:hypothetical protein [Candidatus Syntrophopropionicum ammoniitolerans]